MMTRRSFIPRAAALLLLTLALLGLPQMLRAQEKCFCDHYTFRVDAGVGCKVAIAWTFSPKGPVFTQTLGPGDKYKIPCPVYEAYIETCQGSYTILPIDPAGRVCSPILTIVSGCCIQACYGIDREGCRTIDIKPAGCVNDIC